MHMKVCQSCLDQSLEEHRKHELEQRRSQALVSEHRRMPTVLSEYTDTIGDSGAVSVDSRDLGELHVPSMPVKLKLKLFARPKEKSPVNDTVEREALKSDRDAETALQEFERRMSRRQSKHSRPATPLRRATIPLPFESLLLDNDGTASEYPNNKSSSASSIDSYLNAQLLERSNSLTAELLKLRRDWARRFDLVLYEDMTILPRLSALSNEDEVRKAKRGGYGDSSTQIQVALQRMVAMTEQNTELQEELVQMEESLRQAWSQVQHTQLEASRRIHEKQELENTVQQHALRAQQLQNQLQAHRNAAAEELNEAKKAQSRAVIALRECKSDALRMHKQLQSLHQNATRTESELCALRSKHSVAQHELTELRNKQASTEAQLQLQSEKNRMLSSENAALTTRFTDLCDAACEMRFDTKIFAMKGALSSRAFERSETPSAAPAKELLFASKRSEIENLDFESLHRRMRHGTCKTSFLASAPFDYTIFDTQVKCKVTFSGSSFTNARREATFRVKQFNVLSFQFEKSMGTWKKPLSELVDVSTLCSSTFDFHLVKTLLRLQLTPEVPTRVIGTNNPLFHWSNRPLCGVLVSFSSQDLLFLHADSATHMNYMHDFLRKAMRLSEIAKSKKRRWIGDRGHVSRDFLVHVNEHELSSTMLNLQQEYQRQQQSTSNLFGNIDDESHTDTLDIVIGGIEDRVSVATEEEEDEKEGSVEPSVRQRARAQVLLGRLTEQRRQRRAKSPHSAGSQVPK
ncbi:MAG: hypothetical protein MHM6MM_000946 [Cercozoa sp. M6MM]